MLDIYAKVILIGWWLIVILSLLDKFVFADDKSMIDIKYYGTSLAIFTWAIIFSSIIYAPYFIVFVL